MSEAYAYIMPQQHYANLGFYHGAAFADEHPLLEGSGKKLRHIKVRTRSEVANDELAQALRAAIGERAQALGRG